MRTLKQLIPAVTVSDGAGVKIKRSLGQTPQLRLDPFLMLDCFGSEQADDYIAGFPAHPHRGFETVTYMLDGHMLHEDHLGNKGHLKSGGVQWMTAGRGIIHSEMPQQESGLMRGFQLWLNLPAAEKMKDAAYVDITAEQIPLAHPADGITVKVIAGIFTFQQQSWAGPIQGLSTEPLYFDIHLTAGHHLTLPIPDGHHALLYPYEGEVKLSSEQQQVISTHHAAVLSTTGELSITAEQNTRVLLLAAKPINEPIVQYGPFVMNTAAEIEQAIRDYQQGKLTSGHNPSTIKLHSAS
ncbi:putative quercetin 2,3-dioxygenase [Alishewanella longhuensis]|uniref:Quercetin 2,3-dioxygenase n=1 Tax=Alishewanella longhuensis TaxID=1091037 RepID=A0ABQ3KZU9_9ALTE|nr:pirin family protein [Alishewanella longhuensis]GHG73317.1 putative quercetin 2,3-dioxygenase [Alishewanella longhuensis]